MELVISKTAQIQISDFIKYYNNRNQTNAYSVKLIDALLKAFERISAYPNLGRPTTESQLRVITILKKISGLLFISGKADNHCFYNSH